MNAAPKALHGASQQPIRFKLTRPFVETLTVKDLCGVPAGLLGSEFVARGLAYPLAIILGVVELAHLGGGVDVKVVLVGDPSTSQGCPEPQQPGLGVVRSADTTALAYVDQQLGREHVVVVAGRTHRRSRRPRPSPF